MLTSSHISLTGLVVEDSSYLHPSLIKGKLLIVSIQWVRTIFVVYDSWGMTSSPCFYGKYTVLTMANIFQLRIGGSNGLLKQNHLPGFSNSTSMIFFWFRYHTFLNQCIASKILDRDVHVSRANHLYFHEHLSTNMFDCWMGHDGTGDFEKSLPWMPLSPW